MVVTRRHEKIFRDQPSLDLTTRLCQGVPLKGPLGNSPGSEKGIEEALFLFDTPCAMVTYGSITLPEMFGNPYPFLHFSDRGLTLNSIGLANLGRRAYENRLQGFLGRGKPVIISYAGFCPDDFAELPKPFVGKGFIHEMNGGCPNGDIGDELIVNDPAMFEESIVAMKSVVGDEPVIVKLGTNSCRSYVGQGADILNRARVHAVAICNAGNDGLLLDEVTDMPVISRTGLAGISGPAMLAQTMGLVYKFRKELDPRIDIIAENGIDRGIDIYHLLRAGATSTRVASVYLKEGPAGFVRLIQEFKEVMHERHIRRVCDIPRLPGLPPMPFSVDA